MDSAPMSSANTRSGRPSAAPDDARATTGAPRTLAALLFESTHAHDTHIALICDDEVLTYGTLRARASAVARALQASGVRAGERVAILLPNGAAYLETFFGATGPPACPRTRTSPTTRVGLGCADSAAWPVAAPARTTAAQRRPGVERDMTDSGSIAREGARS